MTQERKIAEFRAVDDDGTSYTVIEWQVFDIRRDVNGNRVDLPGLRYLKLVNGEDVNRLQDGSLQIFETGKIIRKVG
jgi:hypothetical protein